MDINEQYSIKQAVEDGVLLDATHISNELGMPFPIYITAAFWNSVEISCSQERLKEVIDVSLFDIRVKKGEFGKRQIGTCPDPKIVPWMVTFFIFIERSDTYGAVIFISEIEEDFDLSVPRTSAGGSFFTM